MPKVSVIVPVYNAAEYLRRCIDSILTQSFQDFELILINDGSKDNSLSVLEEYAAKDNRIILIDQENRGVSSARNSGLKNSTGDFILFVDADDFLSSDYLDSFMQSDGLNLHDYLVIQGCTWYMDGIERKYICKKGIYSREFFPEILSEYEIFRHGSPYGKLYSNRVVKENNITFNKAICNYEDLLFFLEYICYIEGLKFIESTGYHYNVIDGGLHSKDSGIEGEKLLLQEYIKYTRQYWNTPGNRVYSYTKVLLIRLINAIRKYSEKKDFKNNLRLLIRDFDFIFLSPNDGIRKKDVIFLQLIRCNLFCIAFCFQGIVSRIKR